MVIKLNQERRVWRNPPGSVTNVDLGGLMGECEMECALARMINIAWHRYTPFAQLAVVPRDFKDNGFELDGYRSLIEYGWLVAGGLPPEKLVDRVRKLYPQVV